MFQQGAMPMLAHLKISVSVLGLGRREDPVGLGLGYLPFLELVILYLQCSDASAVEVVEVEAMLRIEVHVHPNHPTLNLEEYHCQSQQVCTYIQMIANVQTLFMQVYKFLSTYVFSLFWPLVISFLFLARR